MPNSPPRSPPARTPHRRRKRATVDSRPAAHIVAWPGLWPIDPASRGSGRRVERVGRITLMCPVITRSSSAERPPGLRSERHSKRRVHRCHRSHRSRGSACREHARVPDLKGGGIRSLVARPPTKRDAPDRRLGARSFVVLPRHIQRRRHFAGRAHSRRSVRIAARPTDPRAPRTIAPELPLGSHSSGKMCTPCV